MTTQPPASLASYSTPGSQTGLAIFSGKRFRRNLHLKRVIVSNELIKYNPKYFLNKVLIVKMFVPVCSIVS